MIEIFPIEKLHEPTVSHEFIANTNLSSVSPPGQPGSKRVVRITNHQVHHLCDAYHTTLFLVGIAAVNEYVFV